MDKLVITEYESDLHNLSGASKVQQTNSIPKTTFSSLEGGSKLAYSSKS
jgi:hypothetical protein